MDQGFDQVLTDYLHPRKFPVIGNIAKWFVRLASGGVLVGIYQFNTTDIGQFLLSLLTLRQCIDDSCGNRID
jgi:hypothetical protein